MILFHAGHDELMEIWEANLDISIHMPHAGHDDGKGSKNYQIADFNPHAPCGA